jgi:hypothetical protein
MRRGNWLAVVMEIGFEVRRRADLKWQSTSAQEWYVPLYRLVDYAA